MKSKATAPLIFLILILCSVNVSHSQNYRTAISINGLGILQDFATVQYENAISGEYSFTGRIDFLSRKISGDQATAFGFGGSYRWYLPPNRAISGLWIAPAVDIIFLKWSHANESISQMFFFIEGEVGYKWFFDQWVVEPTFYLGFGIGKADYKGRPNVTLGYGNGIIYGVGLSLGYAW